MSFDHIRAPSGFTGRKKEKRKKKRKVKRKKEGKINKKEIYYAFLETVIHKLYCPYYYG
jgi:hypothetical protein